MHNDGHQDIHPAQFQKQSETSQLALSLYFSNDTPKVFMSINQMKWLLKEAGISVEHELIESLCQHLNNAVNRQQQQPVKHLKSTSYETIIYWDTWGLIKNSDGNLKAGIHVWNNEIGNGNIQITSIELYINNDTKTNLPVSSKPR